MTNTSVIDRIIREIAPAAAVRRIIAKQDFDYLSGSLLGRGSPYEAVATSRLRQLQALNRSVPGDEEHQGLRPDDRRRMLLETRDLYRNSPLTRGIVKCFTDYAVFNGVWPQAATSDPSWNKEADDYYRDVIVPTADFRQRKGVNLVTMQKLAIQHRLIDGDLGFIQMANGQLFPVEGSRIDTPTSKKKDPLITMGVKLTAQGILVGYHVLQRKPDGRLDPDKSRLVKRELMLHMMSYDRIAQVRGIPDLHSVVTKLRDLHTTEEYILNKVKQEGTRLYNLIDGGSGLASAGRRGGRSKTDADDKDITRVIKTEWGSIQRNGRLEPIGESSPNSRYMPFIEHHVRVIAGALRIPFEYLMMMFTSSSFSAQRAGQMHANHTFTGWSDWLISEFLQPHRTWRIAKAIKNGELPPAPVDDNGVSEWFRTEWAVPFFGTIDPQKQAIANRDAWNNGERSMKMIIRSQGGERDRVFADKAEDIMVAHLAAMRINEQTELKLTWRDIINTANNTQQSISSGVEVESALEEINDKVSAMSASWV